MDTAVCSEHANVKTFGFVSRHIQGSKFEVSRGNGCCDFGFRCSCNLQLRVEWRQDSTFEGVVEALGCEISWSQKQGLKVVHPTLGTLRAAVVAASVSSAAAPLLPQFHCGQMTARVGFFPRCNGVCVSCCPSTLLRQPLLCKSCVCTGPCTCTAYTLPLQRQIIQEPIQGQSMYSTGTWALTCSVRCGSL